jgi:hypothetical protein
MFYLIKILVLIEPNFGIEYSRLIGTAVPVKAEVLHDLAPNTRINATRARMCYQERLFSFFFLLDAH